MDRTTGTPKAYLRGTHRACSPETSWQRIEPYLQRFGITRVASITGLDTIGIPTVIAIRPASRSLSVTQGKGVSLMAAKVSAVMEAIEHAHAENIRGPRLYAKYSELSGDYRMACVDRMCAGPIPFDSDREILWRETTDLREGQAVLCPYEAIHLDLRLPQPPGSGHFAVSSNGLASGNDLHEATCHALFELVERDATTRFYDLDCDEQARLKVNLDTVDVESCRNLLESYENAQVDVAVWETTSQLGIPAFLCDIMDRPVHALRHLPRARGMGCHATREIALARALCEAAQSRLTLISGARDDIESAGAQLARSPQAIAQARGQIEVKGQRHFTDAPNNVFDTFDEEQAYVIERLAARGYPQVLRADLTLDRKLPMAVVRVVVPGLCASNPYVPRSKPPSPPFVTQASDACGGLL